MNMPGFTTLVASAGIAGVLSLGTLIGAAPASAGPASPQDEASFLSWVHRFAADMGVTGSDAELLSDGYYTCHLRALGDSPARVGISPLITTHAYTYLCPAYDR
jgi:hypothetical protein